MGRDETKQICLAQGQSSGGANEESIQGGFLHERLDINVAVTLLQC